VLLFPKTLSNNNDKQIQKDNQKRMSFIGELIAFCRILIQIYRCLIFVFLLNIPPTLIDVFYTFIYDRYCFTNQQYQIDYLNLLVYFYLFSIFIKI